MSVRPEFWLFLALMAVSSLACRFGGFWLMRFVTVTPRVEATLKAMPLAVMAGIVAPAAARGSWPEWLALCVTAAAMRFAGNDLAAAVAGVAVLAALRAWGALG